jgi:hypothetical protein
MIRYKASTKALVSAIEQHRPGWGKRAKQKTREVSKKRHVDEKDGIWSEIKAVFASLQHYKCVYCEKPLPREDDAGKTSLGKGAVEYDVEHFRPKNAVKAWPSADLKKQRNITYDDQLSMGEAKGYLRLAFDPTNYALSCKTCNSGHKGNSFPIAGKTNKRATLRREQDASEMPLLLLPLGDDADDPEQIIGWDGPLPMPKKKRGLGNLRAKVCIDLFALDTRTDLRLLRCLRIWLLWGLLVEHKKAKGAQKIKAAQKIRQHTADHTYFAACARAYVALFRREQARAREISVHCRDYVASRDRSLCL